MDFFFHYGYQIERKKFGFSFSVNWTSAFSQLQIEEPVFKIDIVDKGFSILKTLMYVIQVCFKTCYLLKNTNPDGLYFQL